MPVSRANPKRKAKVQRYAKRDASYRRSLNKNNFIELPEVEPRAEIRIVPTQHLSFNERG